MEDHSLPAGTFKATCLKLMDEVADTGKSVTITKRGKAVARLVPIVGTPIAKPKSFFGALAHCTSIVGDIEAPLAYRWRDPAEKFAALLGPTPMPARKKRKRA